MKKTIKKSYSLPPPTPSSTGMVFVSIRAVDGSGYPISYLPDVYTGVASNLNDAHKLAAEAMYAAVPAVWNFTNHYFYEVRKTSMAYLAWGTSPCSSPNTWACHVTGVLSTTKTVIAGYPDSYSYNQQYVYGRFDSCGVALDYKVTTVTTTS